MNKTSFTSETNGLEEYTGQMNCFSGIQGSTSKQEIGIRLINPRTSLSQRKRVSNNLFTSSGDRPSDINDGESNCSMHVARFRFCYPSIRLSIILPQILSCSFHSSSEQYDIFHSNDIHQEWNIQMLYEKDTLIHALENNDPMNQFLVSANMPEHELHSQ